MAEKKKKPYLLATYENTHKVFKKIGKGGKKIGKFFDDCDRKNWFKSKKR